MSPNRFAAILLALSVVALGCREEVKTAVVTAPPVLVAPVETRTIVDRIEASGQLLAKWKASVSAQVGGQITKIYVDEGSEVEDGQLLLEIDPERRELEVMSQRALVAERQAQLKDAEREAGRLRNLRSKGASSQSQVDEAETGLELARVRTQAARAQLGLALRAVADSSVKAPFAGQVSRRRVNEGEFVTMGQPLVEMVSLDDIEVEFHLAERDSGRVRDGARVEVRVAPFPDEVFAATVTMISPTIDKRTRTLRVKAALDDPDSRLRPGLFARADLGLRTRDGVVMVPEESVILRADGSAVFKLTKEDQVARVPVVTGVHEDGWIEVVEGLAAGDVVVVRGQTRLIDGSVVRVRTVEGREPGADSADVAAQAAR